MEHDYEHQSHPPFPEDKDAPIIDQKSSFLDYFIFGLIAFSTLLTVSFSLFIIVIKYL